MWRTAEDRDVAKTRTKRAGPRDASSSGQRVSHSCLNLHASPPSSSHSLLDFDSSWLERLDRYQTPAFISKQGPALYATGLDLRLGLPLGSPTPSLRVFSVP
jgi:hypothetical protein